jgi:hypothetical protein
MPASLTTHNLGNSETSKDIRQAVTEFFKQDSRDWIVSVIGAQTNDTWRVTASDGKNSWKHDLHSGEHSVEAVLTFLKAAAA